MRSFHLFQPALTQHTSTYEYYQHNTPPPSRSRMPTRRNRQPPARNLSWFRAPRRIATLRRVFGIDARNQRRLEQFRHHIREHDIPYFTPSHQVFVLGPHSRQYFRASLLSLLTLDYVPLKVRIPGPSVPHDCIFCPRVNPLGPNGLSTNHRKPFEYILAVPRSRGRPRRETISSVDSEGSDSSSDTSGSSAPDVASSVAFYPSDDNSVPSNSSSSLPSTSS